MEFEAILLFVDNFRQYAASAGINLDLLTWRGKSIDKMTGLDIMQCQFSDLYMFVRTIQMSLAGKRERLGLTATAFKNLNGMCEITILTLEKAAKIFLAEQKMKAAKEAAELERLMQVPNYIDEVAPSVGEAVVVQCSSPQKNVSNLAPSDKAENRCDEDECHGESRVEEIAIDNSASAISRSYPPMD